MLLVSLARLQLRHWTVVFRLLLPWWEDTHTAHTYIYKHHTHNTLTRHIYIHTYKYICIHEGTYVHTCKVGFFVIMFAVVCSDSEIHGLGVIPNLPVLRGKNLKVALFPRSSMILCFLEPWGGRNSRPCREMPLPVAPRFFWGEGS